MLLALAVAIISDISMIQCPCSLRYTLSSSSRRRSSENHSSLTANSRKKLDFPGSRLSARSVLQKASGLLRSPQATRTSLHSCAEQPDRQNFAKSSLPACPVLLRCRSARKLFLPDFLRRMASSWCALVVAALLRKSIVACSRSCCCQGTMLFCKKLWTFQNAKGFVSESSPYTLYKLKGAFLNRVLRKFKENSLF